MAMSRLNRVGRATVVAVLRSVKVSFALAKSSPFLIQIFSALRRAFFINGKIIVVSSVYLIESVSPISIRISDITAETKAIRPPSNV